MADKKQSKTATTDKKTSSPSLAMGETNPTLEPVHDVIKESIKSISQSVEGLREEWDLYEQSEQDFNPYLDAQGNTKQRLEWDMCPKAYDYPPGQEERLEQDREDFYEAMSKQNNMDRKQKERGTGVEMPEHTEEISLDVYQLARLLRHAGYTIEVSEDDTKPGLELTGRLSDTASCPECGENIFGSFEPLANKGLPCLTLKWGKSIKPVEEHETPIDLNLESLQDFVNNPDTYSLNGEKSDLMEKLYLAKVGFYNKSIFITFDSWFFNDHFGPKGQHYGIALARFRKAFGHISLYVQEPNPGQNVFWLDEKTEDGKSL